MGMLARPKASVYPAAVMTNEERKSIVRQSLTKGLTLSQIQDYLHKEKNDPITYMDLRLLLSEMPDAKLPEKEVPKTVVPIASTSASTGAKAAPKNLASPTEAKEPGMGGRLSISVDQVPAPGSMLSGYVRFSSGAKAHWFLDDMGRLGLEPELGTGKPTQTDMQEFSTELRRMLQQAGGM
jgi:DNA-binding transcriptional MerR regulator